LDLDFGLWFFLDFGFRTWFFSDLGFLVLTVLGLYGFKENWIKRKLIDTGFLNWFF
jgi:hypothetical protein